MTDPLWTCDTCGKPMEPGDPRYSLADDPEKQRGRHWGCHVPVEKAFSNLRDAIKNTESELDKLRRAIHGKD